MPFSVLSITSFCFLDNIIPLNLSNISLTLSDWLSFAFKTSSTSICPSKGKLPLESTGAFTGTFLFSVVFLFSTVFSIAINSFIFAIKYLLFSLNFLTIVIKPFFSSFFIVEITLFLEVVLNAFIKVFKSG